MSAASRLRLGLLAYGASGRLHRGAAVALLTVQAHRPDEAEIIVLTDRPDLYLWFGSSIIVERLTESTLEDWQGPLGDRYRPKIEALRRLAADGAADVALVDADTMARRDLGPFADRLAAGAVFLHRREYALSDPPRKGDRPLRREILGRSWQGIAPGDTAAMWNGGVIASSRRHRGIFDRTLAVFDEMRVASRHFAVEQLAYSIVFPAYAPIEEARPWFDHYWGNRGWFDGAVAGFLGRARHGALSAADAAHELRHCPMVGPIDARVPWWRRRLNRVFARPASDNDEVAEVP